MIPSMFHRRLLLLATVAVCVGGIMILQLARLTVAQGAMWRQRAEAVLVERSLIPTARGKILDRRMRVLAVDKPSYDVCIRYGVITDNWAYRQGRWDAYRVNRAKWQQIDETERDRLATQYGGPYDAQVENLWQTLCDVGTIDRAELEHRKETVIRRVKHMASVVWDRRLQHRLEEEEDPVSLMDVSEPIGEQVAAHPLLVNVDRKALVRIRSLLAQAGKDETMAVWKQVRIRPSKYRHYPLESMTVMLDRGSLPSPLRAHEPVEMTVHGVGLHLVGTMRNVWKEDVERRPYRRISPDGQSAIDRGGYLPGDRTGSWGLEKSQEDQLRGVRGQVIRRRDTATQDRQEPTAGSDVVLTVDIHLQGRIQAIMNPNFGLMRVQPWHARVRSMDPAHPQLGEPLNGAAVVLDMAHSHVLAAVTVPELGRRELTENPDSVWNDTINQPYLNRPIARAYQPGSIVKPLVLAAAVTDRKIGYDGKINCAGHLHPDFRDRYRCWIYKQYNATHGPLDGIDAIARSCNIFFYTLGRRLGAQQLVSWYDQMGMGSVTDCGLYGEVRGDLPDLNRPGASGFSTADATFMAIGQGPVRWTPLQAASSYAALARGGYVITPTFLMAGHRSGQRISVDLGLDPNGVDMAMKGLEHAVLRHYGTAHGIGPLNNEPIFNIEGVQLYGKSGTAQGVPLWLDQNEDRKFTKGIDRIVRRGDHAWVVCLVQRYGSPRPDFVVAVVVEYGGSGGAVAGPIVNQILHAMRDEGYL